MRENENESYSIGLIQGHCAAAAALTASIQWRRNQQRRQPPSPAAPVPYIPEKTPTSDYHSIDSRLLLLLLLTATLTDQATAAKVKL